MGQHMVRSLRLKSPAFRDNAEIPEKYTCDGENIHPPLELLTPRPDVRTFALIAEDPPTFNSPRTLWLIWNIDPETTRIGEGVVPASAVEGVNSDGTIGYNGPCPPGGDPGRTAIHAQGTNTAAALHYDSPRGEHRYRFTLFALDTWLTLPPGASREELEQAMQGHVLEQATLTGRYERSRPKGESKKRRLLQ